MDPAFHRRGNVLRLVLWQACPSRCYGLDAQLSRFPSFPRARGLLDCAPTSVSLAVLANVMPSTVQKSTAKHRWADSAKH